MRINTLACRIVLLPVALLLLAVSSASAAIMVFQAGLSGSAESPPNASPGTGFTTVTYDSVLHTLRVEVSFSGLVGTTTASHIHCCVAPTAATPTAGVATTTPTFAGFPLGVTSGTYDNTLDLTMSSSFNPSFVTAHGGTAAGAEAFLATGLSAGSTYLNIHTNSFPGGEIRGFLVPEPSTFGLTAFLIPLLWFARRKHAS